MSLILFSFHSSICVCLLSRTIKCSVCSSRGTLHALSFHCARRQNCVCSSKGKNGKGEEHLFIHSLTRITCTSHSPLHFSSSFFILAPSPFPSFFHLLNSPYLLSLKFIFSRYSIGMNALSKCTGGPCP